MRTAAALALVALAALAPSAHASTVRMTSDVDEPSCRSGQPTCVVWTVHYTAAPGESNDARFARDGSAVIVSDAGATIGAQDGCVTEAPDRARCTPERGVIELVRARLGDLDDRAESPTESIDAHGGPGDDHLIGGAGYDVLVAGAGRDRLEGGAGLDDLLEGSGGSAVEPDAMDGGPGRDLVHYGARRRSVAVDLSRPNAGAGEAGEGDSIVGVEEVHGGRGDDMLRAGDDAVIFNGHSGDDRLIGGLGRDRLAGEFGDDRISGGAGKDRIDGNKGNDRLRGGCGADRVDGGAGSDRILDADGSRDVLQGGPDRDFAEFDPRDRVKNVERRRPRTADGCAP